MVFVERVLPGSILRDLGDEETKLYRRPFVEPGEDRRPTLSWPRQIPIEGEPGDVARIVADHADWLGRSDVPRLFVDAKPGAILIGPQREFCRTWPHQPEVTTEGDGPITVVDKIDRNFEDTWHLGVALKHTAENGRIVSGGFAYDSSPVDDEDRTFDLPFDKQVNFSLAVGREDPKGKRLNWSVGGSLLWLGDGKIDQTAQGTRTKGEFDTNILLFIAASAEYRFRATSHRAVRRILSA